MREMDTLFDITIVYPINDLIELYELLLGDI